MDVQVLPKPVNALMATRLVQQTTFWSRVKKSLGWKVLAFDIKADGSPSGDVLILLRDVGGGRSIAYSPFGPEKLPDDDNRGLYLSALSSELCRYLGPGCLFVRWDLPWTSPYAEEEDRYDSAGYWLGPPETRLAELRMNWGVPDMGLRKPPSDILPPDTILVDLRDGESILLARMKPKTRYNIRLSAKKGVSVREGSLADMGLWQRLYSATARRNGIVPHEERFFLALSRGENTDTKIRLLIAERDEKPLAAMFLSMSADRATYLYGASSGEERNLMAPYALQWAAMGLARREGCASYDLFGVAPRPDPDHPMYGLFVFKSGFGGSMLHRQGSWDYPYDEKAYEMYLTRESTAGSFHVRQRGIIP
ncbi:MAG TPA: peptidoglycan bridge formation glycyltransferase FemA/FemB family protein [Rectinemataceae bacterium]|nr:peptidoglycan bridge formation glycyltransferase FemA/FemB family protein [Rectinemataceae bacterium]